MEKTGSYTVAPMVSGERTSRGDLTASIEHLAELIKANGETITALEGRLSPILIPEEAAEPASIGSISPPSGLSPILGRLFILKDILDLQTKNMRDIVARLEV